MKKDYSAQDLARIKMSRTEAKGHKRQFGPYACCETCPDWGWRVPNPAEPKKRIPSWANKDANPDHELVAEHAGECACEGSIFHMSFTLGNGVCSDHPHAEDQQWVPGQDAETEEKPKTDKPAAKR